MVYQWEWPREHSSRYGLDLDSILMSHAAIARHSEIARHSQGAQTVSGISLNSAYSVQGYSKSERLNVCMHPPIFICLMMREVRLDSLLVINHSCPRYYEYNLHILPATELEMMVVLKTIGQ